MTDHMLKTDREARQRLPKTRLEKWADSWKQVYIYLTGE